MDLGRLLRRLLLRLVGEDIDTELAVVEALKVVLLDRAVFDRAVPPREDERFVSPILCFAVRNTGEIMVIK